MTRSRSLDWDAMRSGVGAKASASAGSQLFDRYAEPFRFGSNFRRQQSAGRGNDDQPLFRRSRNLKRNANAGVISAAGQRHNGAAGASDASGNNENGGRGLECGINESGELPGDALAWVGGFDNGDDIAGVEERRYRLDTAEHVESSFDGPASDTLVEALARNRGGVF